MSFDPTKPVKTRDGKAARIICADRKGSNPIVALVRDGENEISLIYKADGMLGGFFSHSPSDLVNIEEPIVEAKPSLDLTKPLRLRDGTPVRILCTDADCDGYPVVGLVGSSGDTRLVFFTACGRSIGSTGQLVQAPHSGTKWINIWSTGPADGSIWSTRGQADEQALRVSQKGKAQHRLACVSVDWEEGQGL